MNLLFKLGLLACSTLLFCSCLLYAGPVMSQASADSLWSFSTIRTDADGDKIPDYLGEEVTISGIANIASGLLHEHYLQIFVQNDSSGMSVFSMQIDTPIEVGDSIIVKGKIDQYNGLTEVRADSYRVIKNVPLPPIKSLNDAIIDPAHFLGMLVEGEGNIIEKGSTFNGKYVRIAPENNSESMMIYVSNFHRLFSDFNFDVLSIGDKISVTGVVTEYNPDFPDEQTYKLFLRTPQDLNYIGLPIYYIYLISGGFALTTLLIFGWVIILRRRVNSKTKEIQKSLKQKEVLLKEIHHRVKNSLSIVSGLIQLQIFATENEEAINMLQKSQTRIQSVALIHEKLYKTKSLSDIELDVYIKELVETIHSTFTEYKDAVDLYFNLEKIEMDTDRVIHCGLLINELVVNAFKHAFSTDKRGKLTITLHTENEHVLLKVSDNGPGLPKDFDTESEDSLGARLIDSLTIQLQAKMDIQESPGGGTEFLFEFPIEPNRK